jgi:hypothetical protein
MLVWNTRMNAQLGLESVALAIYGLADQRSLGA